MTSTGGLVRYERQRFPRGDLRRWLLQVGPQDTAEVVAWVSLRLPAVDEEVVAEELAAHPRLFVLQLDGRWAGRPDQATVVVVPRPARPARRPASRTRRAARAESPAQPAREPASRDPFHTESGALRSLIFRRDVEAAGEVYESGGRLVVPMPQEVEATDVVRRALLNSCEASAEVEVFEQIGADRFAFRGTRRLLEAAAAPGGTRVELVFDRADDDEGRYAALALSGPASGPATTGTLALALPPAQLAAALGLPAALQEAALAPSPTGLVVRPESFTKANELLLAVKASPRKWEAFREWLINQKRRLDADALERILVMAVERDYCPKAEVLALARLVVGDEPATHEFAVSFVIAAADLRQQDALAWAGNFVGLADPDESKDVELVLSAARVCIGAGDYVRGCRLMERAIDLEASAVGPKQLEDYLLMAHELGDEGAQRAAITALDACLEASASDAERFRFVEAQKLAVDIEDFLRLNGGWERHQAVVRSLVLSDPRAAVKEVTARCAGTAQGVMSKLDLLALMEESDSSIVSEYLPPALIRVVEESLMVPNATVARDAVDQLQFVEAILGLGHVDSEGFDRRLRERNASLPRAQARRVEAQRNPFLGKTIAIGNGHPNTRRRLVERLLDAGAAEVREIPSSEEAKVTKDKVRPHVEAADIVVTLVDYGSHAFTHALDALSGEGARYTRIRAAGGPSRILRTIREHLATGA